MVEAADILAGLILASAILYSLTGGADFGGGVWDLLASGPRKARQRKLIEDAITPVWEVNHIWMILMVVVMFSAFPKAFGPLCTALHIPLTLMLIGIVARGTAFTFRTYDRQEDHIQRRWGLLFSGASIITPLLLGNIIGSLSTGAITVEDGIVTSGFLHPWATSAFPWIVGALALSLYAYLASVYLANEASEEALADDFRVRALISGAVATVIAGLAFLLSEGSAPELYRRLGEHSLLLFASAAISAIAAISALLRRHYRLARRLAVAQVSLIVGGWGIAQYPDILMGTIDIQAASAPADVQWVLCWVFVIGSPPLAACIYYLMRTFKSEPKPQNHDSTPPPA